jgi:hypothetical protein
MEIVENTLDVPLAEFLDRPLFCFLAQQPAAGARVSPLWFHWEESVVWIIARTDRSYADRVREFPSSALAVVDFDPTSGRVEHVGMRGTATLAAWDPARARRLLEGYLGPDREEWDPMFAPEDGDGKRLLRFDPETVVARDQSYRGSLDA